MKQILQNLSDGRTLLAEVPRPLVGPGQVLVRTRRSLVSAGTERMLVEFGKAGWLDKARQQPDKVRMVLDKVRTDGILATLDAVRSKLDQPLPLGYSNVGVVAEVGSGVTGLRPGDRVASNGHHAEFVAVPVNLTARVPDEVSDEAAAFTVVGAIGLQGVRLAAPTLGETFVVMGLGLIGLVTVQLLRAHGCRVIGLDFDAERLALAERLGARVVDLRTSSEPVAAAIAANGGAGIDGVLITASTDSSEPVTHAARMSRKRGRIVLVGVSGLELSRADFFEKELTFQVSCSYGPGRYDPDYEQKGRDYPVGYVRWTEQRNFEAVLGLLAEGKLDIGPLVSHRFALERAEDTYALLASNAPSLGIVLEYPEAPSLERTVALAGTPRVSRGGARRVSFIGAGNYASRVLIPAFASAGMELDTLVSAGGVTAKHHGSKHGFARASSDVDAAIGDPRVDAVVIATRHDLHGAQVLAALRAGKHVFCEKPLCLREEELDAIEAEARARPEQIVMVGFNRRFAPTAVRVRSLLGKVKGSLALVATVNAGAIPGQHWTQDSDRGGGRVVGEGCHFIDFLRFLSGQAIVSAEAERIGEAAPGTPVDNALLRLRFADGSLGSVFYLSHGHKAFPKERIEAFGGGVVVQLDNFREVHAYGASAGKADLLGRFRQDKGNAACVQAFVDAVKVGGPSPIPFDEIVEVSRASIRLQRMLDSGAAAGG